MKQKLNITILMLFAITNTIFAQSLINKCKGNTKDHLVKIDSSKRVPIVVKKSKATNVGITEKTQKTEATKSLPMKVATVKVKETTVKAK